MKRILLLFLIWSLAFSIPKPVWAQEVNQGQSSSPPAFPPAASAVTDLNQGGSTTLLPFKSTTGLSAGQVVAGTNITDGTTIASIVSTAQTTLPANGSFAGTQKVIPMAVTASFATGQQCHDNTLSTVIGDGNVIASIQANTSITMTSNVNASMGATDSITCDPVVTLSAATTGTISAGAQINFFNDASAATAAGKGTFFVNGGMAIAGKLFLASSLNVAGSVTVPANSNPLSSLAQIATNTILGNTTSGTANVTAVAVGTCSTSSSALIWTTNTGPGCNTSINAATLGGSALGTSGTTVPLLSTANTWTLGQTFSALITPTSSIGIKGTATNDNAQAGSIGEIIEANCAIATSGASISFTSASPTVGTWSGSPWSGTGTYACPMNITANAPTGLSTATNYWIVPINSTTFHVATTAANALAGTFANTSGTSSTANLTTTALLATGTAMNLGSVVLTAGDWECFNYTVRALGSTTTVTDFAQGINQTSAQAIASWTLGQYTNFSTASNVMNSTFNSVHSVPSVRESVSGTTNLYSEVSDTFGTSTDAASSDLRCRRVR